MTKNHTFIRSLVLGAALMFTAQANAEPNRVLVAYYDVVLFKNSPPKCSVNDDLKSNWLKVFDDKKCFLRQQTADKQLFISGVTSPCTVEQIKAAVDKNLELSCATAAAGKGGATPGRPQNSPPTQSGAAGGQAGNAMGAAAGAVQHAMNGTFGASGTSSIFGNNQQQPQPQVQQQGSSTTTGGVGGGTNKPAGGTDSSGPQGSGNVTRAAVPTTPITKYQDSPLYQHAETAYNNAQANYDVKCAGANSDTSSCKTLRAQVENKQDEMFRIRESENDKIIAQQKIAEREAKENLRTANPEQQKAADGVMGDAAKTAAGTPSSGTVAANGQADSAVQTDDKKAEGAAAGAKGNAAAAPMNCEPELHAVEAAFKTYNAKKSICVKGANTAYNFCDKANSPGLKQVQQFMSLGATALSNMTAATDACRTTSTISKVAQGAVLGAQALCATTKLACDKGCAAASAALEKVKAAKEKLEPCAAKVKASADTKLAEGNTLIATPDPTGASKVEGEALVQQAQGENTHSQSVTQSAKDYQEIITGEEESATVTAKVGADGKPDAGNDVSGGSAFKRATAMCKEKAAVDVALMGSAAVGLLSAFNDAEKCKAQLASGNSTGTTTSGVASPNITTAEYCAVPDNAASITCKCTTDPNAAGCVGGMANSGVVLGKVDSGSGASGFASAKQNGLGSISSLDKNHGDSGDAVSGTGLSAAAREALGMGSGMGEAGSGRSGAANFGSGDSAAAGKGKNTEEPKKFGFFSSISSALGLGKKPDSAAKAAIRSYEQEQAIQRKIASDKVRAEVTTASGKSNFDKIKNAYRTNLSSFEQ